MIENEVDLTCREATGLVSEYLSSSLAPELRATLEQHVFTCPACTIYLRQMKTIVSLASTLAQAPPSAADANEADAIELFRRWKQK
jgi:anti-sigma factor RsiW